MALKLTQLPTLEELKAYSVNRPGQLSALRWELYDFQTYALAGTPQQDFFQVPRGQGGKTAADTNMEAAGSLPNPKAMLVTDIQIFFTPAGNMSAAAAVDSRANDVNLFYNGAAYLQFFIGSTYFVEQGPLVRFPPRNGLTGFSTEGGGLFMDNFVTAGGAPYLIEPQIKLEPTQNFRVSLVFPTAIPTTNNARVGIVLGGYQYRLSQ